MKDFYLNDIQKLAKEVRDDPKPTGNTYLDAIWNEEQYRKPYHRFFTELTKRYKPEVIVELGGWQGVSAAHFAQGYDNGVGGFEHNIILTVDHHTDPGDDVHQKRMLDLSERFGFHYFRGWSVDKVAQEQAGEHALGDAPSVFPNIVEFLNGQKIELLFIDSWHQYKYAKWDWEAYSPLLADKALVICDDLLKGDGPAIGGMRRFWNELPGEEKCLIDGLNPGFPQGYLKYVKYA